MYQDLQFFLKLVFEGCMKRLAFLLFQSMVFFLSNSSKNYYLYYFLLFRELVKYGGGGGWAHFIRVFEIKSGNRFDDDDDDDH